LIKKLFEIAKSMWQCGAKCCNTLINNTLLKTQSGAFSSQSGAFSFVSGAFSFLFSSKRHKKEKKEKKKYPKANKKENIAPHQKHLHRIAPHCTALQISKRCI